MSELVKGCVVMMSASAGMKGYGNAQCVQEVMEVLGMVSLYGHNQHYKIYDIARVLEYPPTDKSEEIAQLRKDLAYWTAEDAK